MVQCGYGGMCKDVSYQKTIYPNIKQSILLRLRSVIEVTANLPLNSVYSTQYQHLSTIVTECCVLCYQETIDNTHNRPVGIEKEGGSLLTLCWGSVVCSNGCSKTPLSQLLVNSS